MRRRQPSEPRPAWSKRMFLDCGLQEGSYQINRILHIFLSYIFLFGIFQTEKCRTEKYVPLKRETRGKTERCFDLLPRVSRYCGLFYLLLIMLSGFLPLSRFLALEHEGGAEAEQSQRQPRPERRRNL